MVASNQPVRKSVWRIALWTAIGGGVGIPLLFLGVWRVILATLHGTEAMVGTMVWLESFRVMFWPSSMFLVVQAPGNSAGGLQYLVVLILINVGVYGLVGLAVGFALRSRTAQVVLGASLAVAMYALNAYWSQHLASFFIAAALLTLVLITFFGKFRATSHEATS